MIKIFITESLPNSVNILSTIGKLNDGSIDVSKYQTLSRKPCGAKLQLIKEDYTEYVGISKVRSVGFISSIADLNCLVGEVCEVLKIPTSEVLKASADIYDKYANARISITKNYKYPHACNAL